MKTLHLFITLLCGSAGIAAAQDAQDPSAIPPPKFPISLRVADKASWVVVTEKQGQASAGTDPAATTGSSYVQKLEVRKAHPLYFEKATVVGGKSWERWAIVAKDRIFQLTKDAGASSWERVDGPRMALDGSDYSNADFEEFAWINASNYKGVETLDQQSVHAFEMKTHVPVTQREKMSFSTVSFALAMAEEKAEGREIAPRVIKAWVDTKTLLPVRYDNGSEVKTYAFADSPGNLSLPADAVAALKDWVNAIQARSR